MAKKKNMHKQYTASENSSRRSILRTTLSRVYKNIGRTSAQITHKTGSIQSTTKIKARQTLFIRQSQAMKPKDPGQ